MSRRLVLLAPLAALAITTGSLVGHTSAFAAKYAPGYSKVKVYTMAKAPHDSYWRSRTPNDSYWRSKTPNGQIWDDNKGLAGTQWVGKSLDGQIWDDGMRPGAMNAYGSKPR